MSGHSDRFPDATYRATVLAPLFEGVKVHYARYMDAINRAHLVMLAETGILARDQAARIAAALHGMKAEIDVGNLIYTGEYEDYFFLIEAELKTRLGDLGAMLHIARSRNDIDHTSFKMALRQRAEATMSLLLELIGALIEKAGKERDTLIVAYTHGQPAQPTTFGHYLGAVIEVLLRDARRMEDATDAFDECPMGAAAITTSGFPINRDRMAELLGFKRPMLNSYGCIASVDYVTGFYSAVKLIFIHLGRVVQDMAFWSSFEVGQLRVPDALVQISSIMPQKRNPVPIEHMRHLASVAAGRCDMIVNTMHNTPFTDINDSEGEVQQAGYAVLDGGARALALMKAFLPACSIDDVRVRRNMEAACITITELADTLVRTEALGFRQAHAISATTARAVIASGQPLETGYTDFVEAFRKEVGRDPGLSQGVFSQAVSPAAFIAVRDRLGGPAPVALEHALARYVEQLETLLQNARQRRAHRARAEEALDKAFHGLVGT